MSRGTIAELPTPAPMTARVPAIYQADDLSVRLLGAFDTVLAPVFASLDNIAAYIDPALTPDDFLDWLAGWVGVTLDQTWKFDRRAFVAVAAQLYRMRGTTAGLAAHVRLFTSGEVEIVESGGSAWSASAGAAPPGTPGFTLHVRVKPPTNGSIDAAKLDALVAAAKPAHVAHTVEVVAG